MKENKHAPYYYTVVCIEYINVGNNLDRIREFIEYGEEICHCQSGFSGCEVPVNMFVGYKTADNFLKDAMKLEETEVYADAYFLPGGRWTSARGEPSLRWESLDEETRKMFKGRYKKLAEKRFKKK